MRDRVLEVSEDVAELRAVPNSMAGLRLGTKATLMARKVGRQRCSRTLKWAEQDLNAIRKGSVEEVQEWNSRP
uniref:Uncharacterized protein n=1 Tax=Fervidicoccus fontis TaxID=683846 RepID=A0A7J3ZJ13_9CREN